MRKLAELEIQDPHLEIRRAEAETAVVQARLRKAELSLEECTLQAPQAGTVIRILVAPGDVLGGQQRQPTVVFAADVSRIVRAEIEQEFAGQVAAGQTVQIQDDVNAHITWRGTVARVSDWYMQRRAIFLEPTRFNDTRTLECLITFDTDHPPPRIGQRVRVLIGIVGS